MHAYDFYEGKMIFGWLPPPKRNAKSLHSYVGKITHAAKAQGGLRELTYPIGESLFSGQSRARLPNPQHPLQPFAGRYLRC